MHERDAQIVYSTIMSTLHKPGEYTYDDEYLMDIDMSILASDEATYNKYAQSIRMEYTQYPDDIYIPGRIDVLQRFLQNPIFHTTEFAKLEIIARANIEREIKKLQEKLPK